MKGSKTNALNWECMIQDIDLSRKKLLIFVDWYLPGYKAGGQIQSCANLAYALHNDLNIYVVTSDRDWGEQKGYDGIIADQWTRTDEGINIYYISPGALRYATIARILQEVQPDSVYLNSMYSFPFTMLPLSVLLFGKTKAAFFLAPRGMLQKGALQFKKFKKRLFLKLFSWLGVPSKIIFHATDKTEYDDIQGIFGNQVKVEWVGDYHTAYLPSFQTITKREGHLKCLFVSRIVEKKNLLYAIEQLAKIKASVELTIIGPVESATYWEQCQLLLANMPGNIKVEYKGAIPNHQLGTFYKQHHLFVLPTYGENYGHVIFDAFVNGRPVLLSDQTPWKHLQERKIGWDIPLQEEELFIKAIESAAGWDQAEFDSYCKSAYAFAENFIATSSLKQKYLSLFTGAGK